MGGPNDQLGQQGERLAEQFLRRAGMKVLARRFAVPGAGELDLVMQDRQTIVFVEVKTQADRKHQDPEQRLTPEKQRRLTVAARAYLHAKRRDHAACRFDLVTVVLAPGPLGSTDATAADITHFADAFTPGSAMSRKWPRSTSAAK